MSDNWIEKTILEGIERLESEEKPAGWFSAAIISSDNLYLENGEDGHEWEFRKKIHRR